jgi:hypothetical protein
MSGEDLGTSCNRVRPAHGALSQQVGDHNNTATRYDTALQLFRNLPNPDCEAEILNQIGRLAHISGNLQ